MPPREEKPMWGTANTSEGSTGTGPPKVGKKKKNTWRKKPKKKGGNNPKN